jgi:STE24 endopeptidase
MRLFLAIFMLTGATAALAQAPAAFDPTAATDAYLASIDAAARARSDAYFEGGYWLILWTALVSAGLPWLALRFGLVARLSGWADRVSRERRWLRALIFSVAFVALLSIAALPWTIYTNWLREHQYGMSNQAFGAWLGEWAMGTMIGAVTSGLLLFALLTLYRRLPRSWWAWGTAVTGLFLLVGLLIAPVFIEPLFNKYTPMEAGPLRDPILAMARANEVPAENVFVVDASRQTKRISANVAGIGPTVRVALNDNLLNRTSPAEVRAVMGHELGHYVLQHVASLLVGFTLLVGVFLLVIHGAAPVLVARYGGRWGIAGPDDPAMLAPAMIVATVVALLLTPVTNSLIRFHESQADHFGINASRAPDGWARVALKLGEYRKLAPSPLEEVIFFDHPSGRTRILMGMRWKAEHLGEPGVE